MSKDHDGKTPQELFPALFEPEIISLLNSIRFKNFQHPEENVPVKKKLKGPVVSPPGPPDLQALISDTDPSNNSTNRAKAALLYIKEKENRNQIAAILTDKGFSLSIAETDGDAIEHLQQSTYALIIADILDAQPTFHQYINRLPISRRRKIFYVLVGSKLHTFYDLEALSLSSNMVINYQHLDYMWELLRAGYNNYYKLYRPYFDELQIPINDSLF